MKGASASWHSVAARRRPRAPRAVRRLHRRRPPRSASRATTDFNGAVAGRHRLLPGDHLHAAGGAARAVGYLRPAEKRANLQVEVECAWRPRFCSRDNAPSGVEFGTDGTSAEGRARSHPVGRHVQFAAAAAALRASGRARCSSATASRWCTTLPRSARGCRTTSTCAPSGAADKADHAERRHGEPVAQGARSACNTCCSSKGPLTVARRLRRRVRAHAAASSKRPDAQIYFINFSTREARRRAASALGLHLLGVAAPGRVARLGAPSARPTRPRRPRSATTTSPPRTTGA